MRQFMTADPETAYCADPVRLDKQSGMDFTLSPGIENLRARTRAFIEDNVLPLEADPENFSDHENIPLARLAPVRWQWGVIGIRPMCERYR
jgi:hypothetical protein